jgi:LmbE family N-acetylglucosaminyl deacetylase
VISRELFLAAGTESCRFEVEVLISRFARQHHLRVKKVLLPNMTHVMKEEKRGVTRGLVERVGMYKDITYFMMRPHRSRRRALRPAYVGFIMFIGLALLSYNLSYVKTARAEAGRLLHLTIGNQTKRILVISTHPDDEALAAGGLIAQAVQSRNQVKVVYLTNGDGFRNGLELFKKKLYLQPQDFLNYGRERMGEAVAAMGQLGLSRDQVVFLGYPDGGLEKIRQGYRSDKAYLAPRTRVSAVPYSDALSPGAAYNTASVLSDLQTVMRDYQPTEIILPNPEDSHPDHRAAGLFTLEAVTAWLKAAPDPDLQLYSYLIHSGLWQVVPSIRKNDLLLPPKRLMERGMDWYNLPMTLESLKQKRLALDQYKSQKKVMASFFANFLRPNEVFCEIRLSDLARFQQSIPAEDQLSVLQFSNNNITNLKNKFFHQGQGGYLPSEADNWASVFPIEQSPLQLVSSNGGL